MPPFNFEHLPLQRPLHGPAGYIKTCEIKIGYGPRSVAEKLLRGLNSVVGFTMEDKLLIDKLSGPENWATWKFQMEHLLKRTVGYGNGNGGVRSGC